LRIIKGDDERVKLTPEDIVDIRRQEELIGEIEGYARP
jgi:hypothetical protein